METILTDAEVYKHQIDIRYIEAAILTILHTVGEDLDREGLTETPSRVARTYLDELLIGYRQDPTDLFKTFDACGYNEMVVVKSIPLASLCEHHLLPFVGVAHVGYIPNGRVLGLSKVARLIDIFARRLQTQERLTAEIAEAMMAGLNPQGVGVVIEAEHMCMTLRGVQKPGSKTVTSALRGVMLTEGPARAEFLTLAR